MHENTKINEPCGANINLMCHSMGNYVLECMFQMLEKTGEIVIAVFKEVVMAAADVDWNALEKPKSLYSITKICDRAHVYFHKGERALALSENWKNSLNRLGKYGPQNIWNIPQSVNILDVSDIDDDEGVMKHHYYYNSDTVVKDIIAVFNGKHTEDIKRRKFITHKNIFRLK